MNPVPLNDDQLQSKIPFLFTDLLILSYHLLFERTNKLGTLYKVISVALKFQNLMSKIFIYTITFFWLNIYQKFTTIFSFVQNSQCITHLFNDSIIYLLPASLKHLPTIDHFIGFWSVYISREWLVWILVSLKFDTKRYILKISQF